MERQYLLVYLTDTPEHIGMIRLTKAEIIERTKDWSCFDYAVFDGECVKDFTNKLNPDSPIWSKPPNS